ncbi:hypothetical protein SDC9_166861 [bioreactor metagenome]|uniref:Uncharacterized protein n=1 Tax=bioreactor metagenome TaxID=1076179 RepID=A0A645FY58_9ZZZZ
MKNPPNTEVMDNIKINCVELLTSAVTKSLFFNITCSFTVDIPLKSFLIKITEDITSLS